MATPEDLRAFEAKKGEVNMGKLFFSVPTRSSFSMYISKTRLVAHHLTAVFCDIAQTNVTF